MHSNKNKKVSKRNALNKKAIFYTMDALLASMLLIGAVLLIYSVYSPEDVDVDQQTFVSQDILTVLSELKLSELNNSFITAEVANGNITNTNKTVLDQIGEYWALNKVDKAQTLLQGIVNKSIPPNYGIRTSMGNNTLLLQNMTNKINAVASNRMISGIEQGRPITGSSGTSYLKKVRNKKTSSYAYFGGFVGQGNVSVLLTLPSDFNSSRTIQALMKVETPGTFKLYFNDQQCGATYTGNVGEVSLWDITSCNSSLNAGTNVLSLRFTTDLNVSYVSGGFIKVAYTTDTLIENITPGFYRYYFPEITGFINLYDTVSVQGNIVNWTLNTTFFNPYQTFFNFGNDTIFLTQGNSSVNQTIVYSMHNQLLPQEPIPIRFAVTNFSNITTTISGLPADSFIVTDTSGSMDDCIGTALNCTYEYQKAKHGVYFPVSCIVFSASSCNNDPDNPCGGAPYYSGRNYNTKCNQSKLDVAKMVDNNFVNTILTASPLHRIGLVDYDTRTNSITPLTSTAAILHSAINGYAGGGSTCTCCGINRARNNLTSSTNPKFMIVLSDGDANICCRNLSDYTGTGNSSSCGVGANNPLNWSILAGQTACANNITVFTIGFGTGMSASGKDAMMKTACNSSSYYNATDTAELQKVFDNITNKILVAANFSSQTVTVVGNYTASKLYGNSYIDIFYNPLLDTTEQNKIEIVTETVQFNGCNTSIVIPPNIDITDAFVTSYSSNHWTKSLTVNDFTVFNLTKYGSEYLLLGDPFIIQVPSVTLQSGTVNTINLVVGDSPSNSSNCSSNNTLIYTALINVSTIRTGALETKVGCTWNIESTSGTSFNITVPKEYIGSNKCNYTSVSIVYNPLDVYDVSVYNMLKQLDYENNGKIFFDLTQNDLEIVLFTTGQVAYMWGPSLMKLEVWQ